MPWPPLGMCPEAGIAMRFRIDKFLKLPGYTIARL